VAETILTCNASDPLYFKHVIARLCSGCVKQKLFCWTVGSYASRGPNARDTL